jgi:hypothetical protein
MIAQRYPTLKEIQVGLHCLTGGSSADELVKRTALLKQAPWGELEFGLASHAFGDAFAHRTQQDAKRMYGGPEGHTFDSLSGDSPDEITINKAREGIYLEYAKEYFDIVKQRNEDPDAKQAKDEEWLDKHLHTILKLEPGAPGTESDGTVFRAVAFTGLNIKMHGYKPQDTAMWWSRYEASGDRMACGVPIAEPDIRRAFLIAKDWTNR